MLVWEVLHFASRLHNPDVSILLLENSGKDHFVEKCVDSGQGTGISTQVSRS